MDIDARKQHFTVLDAVVRKVRKKKKDTYVGQAALDNERLLVELIEM